MKKLYILTDYKGDFLISLNAESKFVSMDCLMLVDMFKKYGFDVRIKKFAELDYDKNYAGCLFLYQTSEAIGQFYKKYIEDIVYHLERNGAIMFPKYEYLKAHHNKGFMELLKSSFADKDLKTIKSKYLGNPIEAEDYEVKLPVVIKQISGAGSAGVYLARTMEEYWKYINIASKTVTDSSYIQLARKLIINSMIKVKSLINPHFKKRTLSKIYRPIVVQSFVENLLGDYKVLYFGGKYFTLYRRNRENDFRASGSGRLHEVPMEENAPLLNFAQKVVRVIDFPIIGIDIGFDGKRYHLLEFQMIHLGPYTLQKAKHYFICEDNAWRCIKQESNLEEEFARSIIDYVEKISGD